MDQEDNVRTRDEKRVQWVDLTKGIAILLVIVGHTVWGGIRAAIFSFHMPLFFILSGITFKQSKNSDVFLKKLGQGIKKLIVPALIIFGIKTIIVIVNNIECYNKWSNIKSFITERILILLFSSGVDVTVLDSNIGAIGMVWFLVALFGAKVLFDYINLFHSSKKIWICLILSVVGVGFGKLQWLPFFLDISLAVQPFLLIGQNYKIFNVENRPYIKLFDFVLVWLLTLFGIHFITGSYLELAGRIYPMYPLCYIAAISATLMVVEFCIIVENKAIKLFRPIVFLGKNSLYMLCIHAMDYLLIGIWKITDNDYINTIYRVLTDVIVFIVLMLIMHFKRTRKYSTNTNK